MVEETETKEISIQADSFLQVKKKRKVLKKTRVQNISKHSIGVGSICIDDTVNIQQTISKQDQTLQSINKRAAFKKKVALGAGASAGVDISRGSIAS